MPLCKHCAKAEADPDSPGWLGLLPLLIGLMPLNSGHDCRDCATCMQLPALSLFVGLLVAGFRGDCDYVEMMSAARRSWPDAGAD